MSADELTSIATEYPEDDLRSTTDTLVTTDTMTTSNTISENPDTVQITIKKNQKYWVSDEVKKRKREWQAAYMRRKKQQLDDKIRSLEERQIKPHTIKFTLYSDRKRERTIETDQQLVEFIDDLLTSLQDAGVITEYEFQ